MIPNKKLSRYYYKTVQAIKPIIQENNELKYHTWTADITYMRVTDPKNNGNNNGDRESPDDIVVDSINHQNITVLDNHEELTEIIKTGMKIFWLPLRNLFDEEYQRDQEKERQEQEEEDFKNE